MTITYTTTWLKGMNTRPTHSVSNAPNGTVAFGATVEVVELWEATADGVNVKAGDLWARLLSTKIQWVAVRHLGVTYGTIEGGEAPPPPPDPEPTVSSQYIVTIDEATKRVILKRGDGQSMTGWTAVIG